MQTPSEHDIYLSIFRELILGETLRSQSSVSIDIINGLNNLLAKSLDREAKTQSDENVTFPLLSDHLAKILINLIRRCGTIINNPFLINYLLDRGANINYIDDCDDLTPIIYAIKYGSVICVKILLERGADHLRVNKNGFNWRRFCSNREIELIVGNYEFEYLKANDTKYQELERKYEQVNQKLEQMTELLQQLHMTSVLATENHELPHKRPKTDTDDTQ